MGFSISDLNPTSLLSNAAESLCDAVLPEDLEFLGDIAGLAVDFESGNYLKCLEDLQDLAQDLPQQLAQLSQSQARAGGLSDDLMPPRFLEPSPPPAYGVTNNTQTTTTTVTTTTSSAPLPAANTVGLPGGPHSTSITSLLNHLHLQMPNRGSQSVAAPVVRGTPASSAPTPASPFAALTSGSTGAPAVGQPSSASPAPAIPTDPFFRLSDADLMNKVASGQIPESISKSPENMRALQARMNQISEMNMLISQMMAALHDMMKSVIQNIRA